MTNISVVICAYTENRWEELMAAVESVQNQTLSPREIILVIDHNPPLLERARSQFSNVIVLENRDTQGASGAKNSGIEAAQGDIIVFLDDDALVDPNWLEKLIPHYKDPKVIGVGGKVEPMYLKRRPTWFPEEFDWVVGCTYRSLPESVAAGRNLIGCNMSFRREVLEHTGGLQIELGRMREYPARDEETDLCIRSSQKIMGGVLLYAPAARVRHRVTPERVSWRYLLQRCYSEGLSEAQLARLVDARDGMASEWHYTLKTLPKGIGRGFVDFITRRDPGGLGRVLAILAGFAATASGYIIAKAAGVFLVK